MIISERELKEFETETHLLLGIETCAACGSPLEGCTARCLDCLETDFEDARDGDRAAEITSEDWLALARRQVFYRQLARLGPANPAATPHVLRFTSNGQLLELPAWK
ncbi:hypothetical protein Deipr_2328 (plasmid) [Deinococcus proteolyticus MRP]|uniref:Uncharacterized protein n=1 Tax=Deinococcus proteolyticus (strain ATCC 35074 / DSM 20540 / JCM 6276 / NBRC 101906 / NCIMB 13154 / VKM Ac-1939 / CCM 2703 / MRP) TaxID=693977 RepID=F0RQ94_DEIPM|nr:hypothetical protein [Deinococcus proteolyticus]ADY27453.1 hypothetical protein Deipr_2328 [Deinococcus proteolyticus MRP]